MMAYQEILYAVDQGIATITLNRPDRLNAWTSVMEHEVRLGMTAAAGDESVKVIMLTGAGRGFCAGADMSLLQGVEGSSPEDRNKAAKKLADETPIPGRLDVPDDFSTRYTYFPSVPKPIIAAINGPAAGLGLIMSLYADFRFAADDAVFTTAFARRGLIAEHGIDWILPRIVGLPNALDLLLSARKVRPDEAQTMGLVNKVFPAASFIEDARSFAKELATMVSPRSMRVMKKQLWTTQISRDLGDAVLTGNAEMLQSFESADFKEGVAHFVEQRAPAFTGT
jgi:enoyl-CoA hydratase/carnithine racemase